MSLRSFHLIFIICATLLCLLMAVWCFGFAPRGSGQMVFILGVVMSVAAVVLPFYGIRFYQKAKNLVP